MVKSEKHFFVIQGGSGQKAPDQPHCSLSLYNMYYVPTYPQDWGGGEERGRLTFLRGKGGEVRWRGVIANGFYICTPVRPVFPTIGHNIIHI